MLTVSTLGKPAGQILLALSCSALLTLQLHLRLPSAHPLVYGQRTLRERGAAQPPCHRAAWLAFVRYWLQFGCGLRLGDIHSFIDTKAQAAPVAQVALIVWLQLWLRLRLRFWLRLRLRLSLSCLTEPRWSSSALL